MHPDVVSNVLQPLAQLSSDGNVAWNHEGSAFQLEDGFQLESSFIHLLERVGFKQHEGPVSGSVVYRHELLQGGVAESIGELVWAQATSSGRAVDANMVSTDEPESGVNTDSLEESESVPSSVEDSTVAAPEPVLAAQGSPSPPEHRPVKDQEASIDLPWIEHSGSVTAITPGLCSTSQGDTHSQFVSEGCPDAQETDSGELDVVDAVSRQLRRCSIASDSEVKATSSCHPPDQSIRLTSFLDLENHGRTDSDSDSEVDVKCGRCPTMKAIFEARCVSSSVLSNSRPGHQFKDDGEGAHGQKKHQRHQ